ncbi:hypothetical protein Tco_1301574 [Tanacetum coccineum]
MLFIQAIENVVENESHFSLEVVDQDLSSLAMFIKHLMVGEEKEEFMGGIGGGSFAKRLMVAKDGLGGDGLLKMVEDHSHVQSKDGEDGGVENKSSMGSRLIVTGEFIIVLIRDSWYEWLFGEVGGAIPMCSTDGGENWLIGGDRGIVKIGIVKKDYGKAENMSVGSAGAILKRAPA